MRCINRLALIGHVVSVPHVPDRMPKEAHFAVVTTRRTPEDTERKDVHHCTAYNRNAVFVENEVRRGDRVYVEGRMEYDQDERARVRVTEVVLLGTAER
jgi:single-stranded DNA-binding protein